MFDLSLLSASPVIVMLATSPQASDRDKAELVPVVLRIDVSALESEQEKRWVDHMQKIAERYVPPMLEKLGIELIQGAQGDAAIVTIAMSWVDYQASIYATDITVSRPGFPDRRLERIICEPCIDHMVVEQLEPHFPNILPWLEVGQPASGGEPRPVKPAVGGPDRQARPSPRTDVTSDIEPPSHGARPGLGALGWAGVATASVGALAVIAGGVVYSRGQQGTAETNRFEQYRDFGPPGIATMVAGGAALSAGAVMLGVQLARRKKTRTHAAMGIGSGFGAVVITHRF